MASVLRVRLPLRSGALRMTAVQRVLPRHSFRAYATESTTPPPPPKSSNTGLFVGVGLLAAGGAAYWFYASDSDSSKQAGTAIKSGVQVAKAATNFVPTKADYQKVYNRIAETLEDENHDDGSYGPLLIRLAWHSSGTYDKETNTGGSNHATMRFAPESLHGANNGLNIARNHIQKIKDEFPWISYGDLWTLGGVTSVQEMAGPKTPWRPGRIDGFEKDCTTDGRLPDGSKAQDHVREIFYRMGFNDQEIVALIGGGHAIGRCHTNASGYDGPWTFSPTTFTNAVFTLLRDEKWSWRKWSGPKQLQDKTKTLMMLPADMTLVQDKKFREWSLKYASDENLFFKDFSASFAKLLELGVPKAQFASDPWEMKTLEEQQ